MVLATMYTSDLKAHLNTKSKTALDAQEAIPVQDWHCTPTNVETIRYDDGHHFSPTATAGDEGLVHREHHAHSVSQTLHLVSVLVQDDKMFSSRWQCSAPPPPAHPSQELQAAASSVEHLLWMEAFESQSRGEAGKHL
mmetsp:Transcript_54071/g.99256  ORF Transcript_54071/g.99256 Transcript_54071/m.99256 type:complete len:138 (+) Transcript_54071:11-424(+)